MRVAIVHIALILCVLTTYAQVSINSNAVSMYTSASQGDIYVDDNGVYYLGLDDGSLKEIGLVTEKGINNGDVLSWNQTDGIWESNEPTPAGLTLSSAFVPQIKRARASVSALSNANQSVVLGLGTFSLNQTNATIASNTISGLTGNLKFTVYLNFRSQVERSNINLILRLNGINVLKVNGAVYARNGNNHNETGAAYLFHYEGATASDEFSFVLEQEAEAGTVALISSSSTPSSVMIEETNTVQLMTDALAPTNLSLAQGPQGPQGSQGIQGPQGSNVITSSDVYHASGNIDSSGTANNIQGATVTRLSTGRYRITFNNQHPNGTHYPIILSMEQNSGDDDYNPTYSNVGPGGFNVEIGEQDNGGSAGVAIDADFSFYVPL
jgi:hypothetical protein